MTITDQRVAGEKSYSIKKIDGKWYVVNAEGHKKNKDGYDTRQEALDLQAALYVNVDGAGDKKKKSHRAARLAAIEERVLRRRARDEDGTEYGAWGDHCPHCGTDWKQPCDLDCLRNTDPDIARRLEEQAHARQGKTAGPEFRVYDDTCPQCRSGFLHKVKGERRWSCSACDYETSKNPAKTSGVMIKPVTDDEVRKFQEALSGIGYSISDDEAHDILVLNGGYARAMETAGVRTDVYDDVNAESGEDFERGGYGLSSLVETTEPSNWSYFPPWEDEAGAYTTTDERTVTPEQLKQVGDMMRQPKWKQDFYNKAEGRDWWDDGQATPIEARLRALAADDLTPGSGGFVNTVKALWNAVKSGDGEIPDWFPKSMLLPEEIETGKWVNGPGNIGNFASRTASGNIFEDFQNYFGGDILRRLNQELADYGDGLRLDYQDWQRDATQRMEQCQSPEEALEWMMALASFQPYAEWDEWDAFHTIASELGKANPSPELAAEAKALWERHIPGSEGVFMDYQPVDEGEFAYGSLRTAVGDMWFECPECRHRLSDAEMMGAGSARSLHHGGDAVECPSCGKVSDAGTEWELVVGSRNAGAVVTDWTDPERERLLAAMAEFDALGSTHVAVDLNEWADMPWSDPSVHQRVIEILDGLGENPRPYEVVKALEPVSEYDSVDREQAFDMACNKYGWDYDVLYQAWLSGFRGARRTVGGFYMNGMEMRFQEGNSNKFYRVWTCSDRPDWGMVHWGRIGQRGQALITSADDAVRRGQQKANKGYEYYTTYSPVLPYSFDLDNATADQVVAELEPAVQQESRWAKRAAWGEEAERCHRCGRTEEEAAQYPCDPTKGGQHLFGPAVVQESPGDNSPWWKANRTAGEIPPQFLEQIEKQKGKGDDDAPKKKDAPKDKDGKKKDKKPSLPDISDLTDEQLEDLLSKIEKKLDKDKEVEDE